MAARTRRLLAWSGALAALAAVFALYTQPHIAVMLAEQIWACFG
ncbi:hypothetical protein PE066_04005 [Ramlibacter tataouinensis]|nr:hypothetical protein [Ramlibacter tataouinensis]WBY04091.1 hypothetical protein PE066_04005 [Ramlibacter tataouinensis]